MLSRRLFPITVFVFAALPLLTGCSATTPSFNTPPLNAPALAPRANSRTSKGAEAARRSAETKLPAPENVTPPKGLFTVEPYLQWGNGDRTNAESVTLCWQTPDEASGVKTDRFVSEIRVGANGSWQKSEAAPVVLPLEIPNEAPQTIWKSTLGGLTAGSLFDYRLLQDGKPVFAGRARARRGANEPYRFAVFGDCAAGTIGQKRIAFQTFRAEPDFVFITGDIVYDRGRASEYREKFFPVYNAEKADPAVGAPLLRSTMLLAVIGNHDADYGNLGKWPDGLAYFYYWNPPLNGPTLAADGRNAPKTSGSAAAEKALAAAGGENYPRSASYSFDYGNSHWTVLDSNYYVDWNNQEMRAWLEKDLANAQKATWRFVAFHIPPFHSSREHRNEQWMRSLCPLFEKYKVDVVWTGHVHNYQRSYPMTFVPTGEPDREGRVEGTWTLDQEFDGDKNTRPAAPIYVVTGGGGAPLYNPDIQQKPSDWQPFTKKYVADTHSLTVVDVDGTKLSVRQISEKGKELDRFVLTK
ncbi:MAG: metallophosphoesterase [Capsulimonadales bacterium]|nr:metallophosphoesterase [Capsulimonadales bacterium]